MIVPCAVAKLPAGSVALPPEAGGSAFDHGDVDLATGHIFVAHTSAGSVEVVDPDRLLHARTIPACPEASGVLCAQAEGLVFAVIDARRDQVYLQGFEDGRPLMAPDALELGTAAARVAI